MISSMKIVLTYFRLSILHELTYRWNFFLHLFTSVGEFLSAAAVIHMVFVHTDVLAGWKREELYVLVGVYFLMTGMLYGVLWRGLWMFMGQVRSGTLDFILTKPADAQLLVSVQRLEISKFWDVILGILAIMTAGRWLGPAWTPSQWITFLGTLLLGLAITYSFIMMLVSSAFWLVKADNIMVIFSATGQAARWPAGIYPRWLKFALTTFVPLGFAVTLPAETLLGRLTPSSFGFATGLAVVFLAASRWLWLKGIRNYSGASA